MSTMPPKRLLRFGMNCAHCDNELIAPEWSEYRNERRVHHVWHCPKCSACFGSLVVFLADTKSMRDIKTGKVIYPSLLPSLLVA